MSLKELRIQFLIGLLLVISSASAQDLLLHGVTSIKISYENPENAVPVSAQIFHSFPAWDVSQIDDTISIYKKEIWLRCPVRTLQEANISIQDIELDLLLIPGDTVDIRVTGPSKAPKVEFAGKTQQIQQYYLARSTRFPIPVSQLMINAGLAVADLQKFIVKADSLYSLDQKFWDQYQKERSLPIWFERYESDAVRYRNAQLRLYILTYQTIVQNKNTDIPDGYFDFLDSISFRNEAAMYDFDYLRFLLEYLKYYKAKAGTESYSQDVEFKLAKEILGDKIGDFYALYSISSALIGNPAKVKIDLAKLTFPHASEYLINYLLSRVESYTKKLRPGDSAPEFFLEDKFDSLISLSQYKGNVVYLSFWFPGCKGCIQEFPFENALVDTFKGKPVKIINICTRTSKSNWLRAVGKYELKTLNLYANTAWQKRLEEKYVINVYPHYVLIDGEGRVIENFATRPSQEASKKIERAINDLKAP